MVSALISSSLADMMSLLHSSVISTLSTVDSARVTARQKAKTAMSILSVAAFIAFTISAPSLLASSTFLTLSCKLLLAFSKCRDDVVLYEKTHICGVELMG